MRWAKDTTSTFGPLERAYVTPTMARKQERRAELQARCPYDLDELTDWGEGEWIDWGQTLYHSPPERPSNVEMLAVQTFVANSEWIDRILNDFIEHFDEFLEGLAWQPQ